MFKNFIYSLFTLTICLHFINCTYDVDILMPHVSPKVKDTYLCYKVKVESTAYITEFTPVSSKDIAHHMLLFGCSDTGQDEDVWNCGEMQLTGNDVDKNYKAGPVCKSEQSIIYAWALDAPKLVLPENVAFKVGPNTKVQYIVLQVHYASIEPFLHGEHDASGVTLTAQDEPVPNRAGVYLFGTYGSIKTETTEYFEAACEIQNDIVLHPFAYRTHSHKLGLVTSGYRVRFDKESNEQEWIEIGRRSPQLPQMFYPTTNRLLIKKGDVIAARCTMKNFQNHDVSIGPTGDDEMCNFYMMYYVEGDKILDNQYCTTYGPPSWYFKNFKSSTGKTLDLKSIPLNASEIPETTEKPVNHSAHQMNHNGNQDDSDLQEILDEDVDYLNRLEEELAIRRFFNKYLHSNTKN